MHSTFVPTTDEEIVKIATTQWPSSPVLWHRLAARAVEQGWWRTVYLRHQPVPYLARFYLHRPLPRPDGSPSYDNAQMLHWILREDDDIHLHDHPAPFTSHVLSGWYTELLPPDGWRSHDRGAYGPDQASLILHPRTAGETVDYPARHLHRITAVGRDTWTFVSTGARQQDWGFWPSTGPWQEWRKYLKIESLGS
jgi:hypothetical protein